MGFPCFNHEPTQAEIDVLTDPAHDPGNGDGVQPQILVDDSKEWGNVTLAVGQSAAPNLQCPQGVDVVRVTVYTDNGTATYSWN